MVSSQLKTSSNCQSFCWVKDTIEVIAGDVSKKRASTQLPKEVMCSIKFRTEICGSLFQSLPILAGTGRTVPTGIEVTYNNSLFYLLLVLLWLLFFPFVFRYFFLSLSNFSLPYFPFLSSYSSSSSSSSTSYYILFSSIFWPAQLCIGVSKCLLNNEDPVLWTYDSTPSVSNHRTDVPSGAAFAYPESTHRFRIPTCLQCTH